MTALASLNAGCWNTVPTIPLPLMDIVNGHLRAPSKLRVGIPGKIEVNLNNNEEIIDNQDAMLIFKGDNPARPY